MPLTATREHSVSWRLSHEPVQVRHAREQAHKALFGWGLGEHAELAELIVSELVINAIRHGDGPIRVRISYDRGASGGSPTAQAARSGGRQPPTSNPEGAWHCTMASSACTAAGAGSRMTVPGTARPSMS
ncbi:MAG TPA: hypothetical protein VG253_02815 [Streptosporangiaceae bacterium]|nr:hypothetical protein [Streptosporangiaceae bacterium]